MKLPVRLLAASLMLASAAVAVPAWAQPLPDRVLANGDDTIVSGRAHVYFGALGTYIYVRRPESDAVIAGFVPFGDKDAFPDLAELDGRRVRLHGVVALDGMPLITLTGRDQLEVVG